MSIPVWPLRKLLIANFDSDERTFSYFKTRTWRLLKLFRDRFEKDFQLNTTLDYSGFDILMADSLYLFQEYISRGNKEANFSTFIRNNRHDLTLYSGKLEYGDSIWRSLGCGVRFFHGDRFVEFMKWENTCSGIYCPEYLNTGEPWQACVEWDTV